MITKKLLDAKDYKGIEDNVRKTIELAASIKAELATK
jgi:2-dehydro-3-deoxyphosphogluconate aldolase / (4S)-4-hydroxy-2-oxoglutarate aldolase